MSFYTDELGRKRYMPYRRPGNPLEGNPLEGTHIMEVEHRPVAPRVQYPPNVWQNYFFVTIADVEEPMTINQLADIYKNEGGGTKREAIAQTTTSLKELEQLGLIYRDGNTVLLTDKGARLYNKEGSDALQ